MFPGFRACCSAYELFEDGRLGEEVRILLIASEGQDRGQVAAQDDGQFVTIRNQFDPFNERAQYLSGASPCLPLLLTS